MLYAGAPFFEDRAEAGRELAAHLTHFRGDPDALGLALPRGGVPVAFEISRELGIAMDVLVVRKLGVPGQEELAMGAIASGGIVVLNRMVIRQLHISQQQIDPVIAREREEVARREEEFRHGRPAPELRSRRLILIDDGLATGSTMRAAAQAVRARDPRSVTVAVPVGAPDSCARLRSEVDEMICLATPREFASVGAFYRNFSQTTDAEVRALLDQAIHPDTSERKTA